MVNRMPEALFRVVLPDGTIRIARGDVESGPVEIVPLDDIAGLDAAALQAALDGSAVGPVSPNARVIAPVGPSQEVWAAGVTYERSLEARTEEAADATPYDLVYIAERPELFFKAPGWRVRGPNEPIAIRSDSGWDVPEPELGLVLDPKMNVIGYTIGNDVSSRTIEGENPLYLPQAKVYDGACALGPALVAADGVEPPFDIRVDIVRESVSVFSGETSTAKMRRSFEELAAHLGRALTLPHGAILLTGTGVVPDTSVTLHEGDVVRIEIDRLGVLENRVETVGRG
jgi:2-dehydro-3-deoxy-D-arabinonate dehydratase